MLPLRQGRMVVFQRKPRDSNSQVAVRPPVFRTGSSSGRMTSVFKSSSGGWNRTDGLLVQSQASLPTATTPDHVSQDGRTRTDDLVLPGHAEYQAFPRPESSERPAGVEPAHPPWQGDRLPLHHGRLVLLRRVMIETRLAGGLARRGIRGLRSVPTRRASPPAKRLMSRSAQLMYLERVAMSHFPDSAQ